MKALKGFTLIELMVTIAVLAIVTSIAAPSFSSMLRSNRVTSIAHELHGALQLARAEAIKRRSNVVICRRNSAGNACENGTNWSSGWLIMQVSGDIIKVWDSAQGVSLTAPNAGVTFKASGLASAVNFALTPSGCTDQQSRTVAVSATGNVILSKSSCPS